MIGQFGINILVPVLACSFFGGFLDEKLGTSCFFIILFFVGAVAGFWNIYRFSRRIFEREILSVDSSTVAYGTPPTAKERYMTLMEENPELLQDVPLKYLASYLYITPQSLSRIRAGLKKK